MTIKLNTGSEVTIEKSEIKEWYFNQGLFVVETVDGWFYEYPISEVLSINSL